MSGSHSRGLSRSAVRARIAEILRDQSEGVGKAELVFRIGQTSAPTVQRALKELERDGAIARDASTNRWHLLDPMYGLPLDHPQQEDLRAVLMAEAMVAPVGDRELRHRLRRLAEQLDERLRSGVGQVKDRGPGLAVGGVTATLTSGTKFDATVLQRMLEAVRREVVAITYESPRRELAEDRLTRRTIEPWQVRLHDGALYVRAWDRKAREPRTFRLAHIKQVTRAPNASRTRAAIPRPSELWGTGDPAMGIDEDRPDTAVITLRGGTARWLHAVVWGEDKDEWVVYDQVLRRTVRYRSCREMARKVLGVIDAVEWIEPAALREEVERAMDGYWSRVRAREAGGRGRRGG